MRTIAGDGPLGAVWAGLLSLVMVLLTGTVLVLAYDRRWDGAWRLVPWGTLAGVSFALVVFLVRDSKPIIWVVRVDAVATNLIACIGGWRHFDEDYKTAPLDNRYTRRWETMTPIGRWWEVMNGSAGLVPILAAGVLIPTGVALWVLTMAFQPPTGGGLHGDRDTR